MTQALPSSADLDARVTGHTGTAVRLMKRREGGEPDLFGAPTAAPVKKAAADDGKNKGKGKSKALQTDPWAGLINRIVLPPYDPATLAGLLELSPDLASAVEAMAANVDGFGYVLNQLRNQLDGNSETEAEKRSIAEEKAAIENFLDVAGDTEDVTALRKKTRIDREATGYAFWEVVRDFNGRIAHFQHLPSREMRLGREDADRTPVTVQQLRRNGDGTWAYAERLVYRRLRRFVQAKVVDRTAGIHVSGLYSETATDAGSVSNDGGAGSIGPLRMWFKSYGDPRVIDCHTGEVVPDEKVKNWDKKGTPMPESRKANEVLYFRHYSARTPYGVPRWISALLHVLGNRAAQEINYTTFRNNNVPSMAITASNGRLTDGSIKRIKQFTESHIQGSQNFSTFLILEGESGLEGDESAQTKIEIKPLTGAQHTDALFVNYTEFTGAEVRKTFRIPSLFTGGMKEINRAAAEEVRRLTDEQVFAPEREDFDREFNMVVFADMGWRFWRYASRTPNVTDNKDLVAMLAAAERTGGITPRIARQVVADVFPAAAAAPAIDKDVHGYDPDVPFSLQVAEKVKNMAGGGELNNQIAPVMPGSNPDENVQKSGEADAVARLFKIGERARGELARMVPELAAAIAHDHAEE